ncbi:uncharacterized protein [Periplaneta americana]|uniref:uncharacterized protein isoform X3 n=1 Tax=Periplaneta americana TaxID=6978 RepID=UPI0037E762A5
MFRLPIRLLHAALRFDFMLLIRNFPTRSQKEDFNTSVTFCCHDCHVNCHLIYRRVAYMMCVFSLIDLYNHWFASFVQVSASHWMSVQAPLNLQSAQFRTTMKTSHKRARQGTDFQSCGIKLNLLFTPGIELQTLSAEP